MVTPNAAVLQILLRQLVQERTSQRCDQAHQTVHYHYPTDPVHHNYCPLHCRCASELQLQLLFRCSNFQFRSLVFLVWKVFLPELPDRWQEENYTSRVTELNRKCLPAAVERRLHHSNVILYRKIIASDIVASPSAIADNLGWVSSRFTRQSADYVVHTFPMAKMLS